MSTKTIFIPGAYSTHLAFNYIRSKLLLPDEYLIEYSVDTGLMNNVKAIKKIIQKESKNQPVNIVSHSMGGLIAVLLHHEGIKINKLVSMSAPLGGSKFAEYIKWWAKNQLIYDLADKKLYLDIKNKPVTCDNLFIVTTKGYNNQYGSKNDCVVSVDSQKYIKGLNYIEKEFTHSEVLMSNHIVDEIGKFLQEK